MKLLIIDNYDSFTYNLVHLLGGLGTAPEVVRNDKITLGEISEMAPEAIIISPGPCTPTEAGICLELVEHFHGKIPIFGVCLGLQSIAQAFGGKIVGSPTLMHGKVSEISHKKYGIFEGIDTPFKATRYHSLCVAPEHLPDVFDVTAQTDDGVIMGLSHKNGPTHGVQFHPESIASDQGDRLMGNFLKIAQKFNAGAR